MLVSAEVAGGVQRCASRRKVCLGLQRCTGEYRRSWGYRVVLVSIDVPGGGTEESTNKPYMGETC